MPLFQNEYKCEIFHMKMSSACSFILIQISQFHNNGFALRLALKQRHKGTRKWPFSFQHSNENRFNHGKPIDSTRDSCGLPGRMGNNKQALQLIIQEENNVEKVSLQK